MSWLEIEDREAVRWVRMDRPEVMNAVPAGGWADLAEAFAGFESSNQRVLVISGKNGAFCSGADLDLQEMDHLRSTDTGVAALKERMGVVASAAMTLHRLTKPSIAAVDGVAVGAGMNLALGCDVVIATTRARFCEIFVRRGLSLDFGGSWLLPRIVGRQRALELALSGRVVEAQEAREIGLCLELVEPERLETRVAELAASFVRGAPIAQMFAKQAVERSWELSMEDALDWEGQSQAICLSTEDHAEGVAAFLEKRSPEFHGR
jgi:2-(1,2-epoxy-1,2-dihydrophenyl)acetyl-CoA isomerase